MPIVQRPTFADHPGIDLNVIYQTHGNDAAITVTVFNLTRDFLPAHEFSQRLGSLLPAQPRNTVTLASLLSLRGIHTPQADTLAINVQSISVDHSDFGCGGRGDQLQSQQDRAKQKEALNY